MNKVTNFWKTYWDTLADGKSSDYELDRGISFHSEVTERYSENKLVDFLDPKGDDWVFDAGCGTGINLRRLSPRVKGIIGMDFSERVIRRAKKRIEQENIDNARLIVGNIAETGLRSNTFDKIVCISVMQYLNDEECEAALNELFRVAKDDAIFVFHVKNLSSLYLATLYVAKKAKNLFGKNVKIEYYRSYRWYEQRLSRLGAKTVDYYSANFFLLDFLPKFLFYQLKRMEMKYNKGKYLRKHGADFHLKAIVKKAKRISR